MSTTGSFPYLQHLSTSTHLLLSVGQALVRLHRSFHVHGSRARLGQKQHVHLRVCELHEEDLRTVCKQPWKRGAGNGKHTPVLSGTSTAGSREANSASNTAESMGITRFTVI